MIEMKNNLSNEYEKMDERIEVRLTPSEKNKFRKYAMKSNHKTLSSYARNRLLHTVILIIILNLTHSFLTN